MTLASADDEFELVRQSFIRRLGDELARLHALKKKFEANDTYPIAVLYEIETFAHRLRGAAAVFDAFELSKAAKALELAASAATHRKGKSDGEVGSTLRVLAEHLTHANGSA